MKAAKDDFFVVRVTAADKKAIEKAAAKAGMLSSDYCRACVLSMMVLECDPHALKALANGVRGAIGDLFEKVKAWKLATS